MRSDGFSLVETAIAAALVTTGLVALAQLAVASTRAGHAAGARTLAVLLAIDKMEQLRALAWTVDGAGQPVSDAALGPSPSDALDRDVDGFVDRSAEFTRRWSVRPLPSYDGTIVVQVRVVTAGGDEARLATLRTRRAN